jgi:hypothetical protein
MSVWFVAYLLATMNAVGWFLMSSRFTGWRVVVLLLAGGVVTAGIAVGIPLYIVLALDASGSLPG